MLDIASTTGARGCLMQNQNSGSNFVRHRDMSLLLSLGDFMMSILLILIKIHEQLILSRSIWILDKSSLTKSPSFVLLIWQLVTTSIYLLILAESILHEGPYRQTFWNP